MFAGNDADDDDDDDAINALETASSKKFFS